MNPKYPVYIVSRGRWESRLTSKALEMMGVPYHIAVEEEEYDKYASVIDPSKILIVPKEYHLNYDTCDNLGDSKSKGASVARNFCWKHSIKLGFERHWVMDDNFDAFHRMNKNIKAEVVSGTIFKCAEDFVDRYENIYIAGLNYYSFCKTTDAVPPYTLNTRIYSCLLIQNNISYRWRGRYNEDTDLSLRVLKDGFCTLQFNAFLAGKVTTQRMKGGNMETFYKHEGTLNKSQMLKEMHPDIVEVVWKFNRWHHHVDYRPFKNNKLIKKSNINVPKGINNYGMILTTLDKLQNEEYKK